MIENNQKHVATMRAILADYLEFRRARGHDTPIDQEHLFEVVTDIADEAIVALERDGLLVGVRNDVGLLEYVVVKPGTDEAG